MKTSGQSNLDLEWRLGPDPEEPALEAQPAVAALSETPTARLDRAIFVVTLEHLAWASIVSWTLASRLGVFGLAPLNANEAGPALYSFDLLNRTDSAASIGFHPLWSGWVEFLRAGFFAAFGADDLTARLPALLAAILIVAMAFEMRHYLGRAGALGTAALIALSPSFTWFAHAGGSGAVATAFALVTVALFMALKADPQRRRALALGVAAGLMVAADPLGLVTAVIFLAALLMLGLAEIATGRRNYLRSRVWLSRYGALAAITIVFGLIAWLVSQLPIGFPLAGLGGAIAFVAPSRWQDLAPGITRTALLFGAFEFFIGLAAIVGVVAILGLRVRSRFAVFCLIWTALAKAFYVIEPERAAAAILIVLLPAALLGGIAVEWLYHSAGWRLFRWVALAVAVLTLYVQVLSNFVFPAPDASAAPWARRANLYWSAGATTMQGGAVCRTIATHAAESAATVDVGEAWPPALRWCARDARPVLQREHATIEIVDAKTNGAAALPPGFRPVDYQETWRPDIRKLTARRALDYLLTERIWSPMSVATVGIRIAPPTESAPTLIVPPG